MKTTSRVRRTDAGNIVLTTMMIIGSIGLVVTGVLFMSSSQYRSTMRSQVWNADIPVVEAGIEEALAHLNQNCISNGLNPGLFAPASQGWAESGALLYKRRYLDTDTYYEVIIDRVNALEPIIISRGYLPPPAAQRKSDTMLAMLPGLLGTLYLPPYPDASASTNALKRTVWVKTKSQAMFTRPIVARGQVDFSGNNITANSFDSSDPSLSRGALQIDSTGTNWYGGQYDPLRTSDNSGVASNTNIINSVNVGNAQIYGTVATGPGGTVATGPNGSVGDSSWVNGGNPGIQPGHQSDDMNFSFPSVEEPFSGGSSPQRNVSVTLTNVTQIFTTNTSASYPPLGFGGTIYTNTAPATSVSYPSGGYLGAVNTNWIWMTNTAYPSGVSPVFTNTMGTTDSTYPAAGTYLGAVVTNTYPVTTRNPPAAGSYLPGTIVTNYRGNSGNIDNYTFQTVSYYYQEITGYRYLAISGYGYNRITGYSRIFTSYTTNAVTKVYDMVFYSGNYQVSGLSGNILVLGDATVYVTGSFSLTGQEGITIAKGTTPNDPSTWGSLRLYCAGPSVSIGGNGVMNETGVASNFSLFGLDSLTDLRLSGNAGFAGTIYAPNADLTLGGGGSNALDFIGAVVCRSVDLNGHYNFHYDEYLGHSGLFSGFVVNQWNEVVTAD